MPKRIWLVALLVAVLLSAPAAWAEEGFYVVGVGGGSLGTKITSVPYTISQPGFYYLGGNLTSSATHAITINADNVTLDLMGCSLTFTGAGLPIGIYLSGRKNVEIRNGTVSGFFYGVHAASASDANHRIINIRADLNFLTGGTGIYLDGKNHLVRDCTASNNNGVGIYVGSGTVSGCVACYNAGSYGIRLAGNGSLLDNIANSNGTEGFFIGTTGAEKILVDGNSAQHNGTNYSAGGAGTIWGTNAGH